jgi:hypothetical protein
VSPYWRYIARQPSLKKSKGARFTFQNSLPTLPERVKKTETPFQIALAGRMSAKARMHPGGVHAGLTFHE